ncbi:MULTISPECIES: hypothetical protein [Pseudomonadota]|uniref:hypothetical protein n=1 Tax=Pseudomonadota TaxID=1224 RepID=UPI00262CEFAE|nr:MULTISPECIES: hypothetical protein [Pseudomonadota]
MNRTNPESVVNRFIEWTEEHPYGARDFIKAFAKQLVERDYGTSEELRNQILEYLDPMED